MSQKRQGTKEVKQMAGIHITPNQDEMPHVFQKMGMLPEQSAFRIVLFDRKVTIFLNLHKI